MGLAQCDVDDMSALARESNPDMEITTPTMKDIPPDRLSGEVTRGYVNPWPFASPVINSRLFGGAMTPAERVVLYSTIVHENWHANMQSFYERGLGTNHDKVRQEAASRTAKVKDKILNGGKGSCECPK